MWWVEACGGSGMLCDQSWWVGACGGSNAARPPQWGGLALMIVRRRPTLPHSLPCSTIGAERLNFRVRNVTGCFPFAMVAVTLWRYQLKPLNNTSTVPWSTSGPLVGVGLSWVVVCCGWFPFVSREPHSGRVQCFLRLSIFVRNKPSAY